MLDEARLRRLYLEEGLSIRAIASLANVSSRTVYDALMRYHIPRRAATSRANQARALGAAIDEASLRRLYVYEKLTIRAIASYFQVSTRLVYNALMRYRIERRSKGSRQPSIAGLESPLDETTLRRLYEQEARSISDISAALACPPSRVHRALVRSGIILRRRGRRQGPRA